MTTVTAFSEGYKQSSNATDYYQKMRALHTCLDRVHMRDDERGTKFEGIMDTAIGDMSEYTQEYIESLPTSKRVTTHCAQLQRRIQKGVKLMNLLYKKLHESDLKFSIIAKPDGYHPDDHKGNIPPTQLKSIQLKINHEGIYKYRGVDENGRDFSNTYIHSSKTDIDRSNTPLNLDYSELRVNQDSFIIPDAELEGMKKAFLGVYKTLLDMAKRLKTLENRTYGHKLIAERALAVQSKVGKIQL